MSFDKALGNKDRKQSGYEEAEQQIWGHFGDYVPKVN
jgi:hypothetical protein